MLDGSKESNCKKAWLREQKYSCCCLFVILRVLLPLPLRAVQVGLVIGWDLRVGGGCCGGSLEEVLSEEVLSLFLFFSFSSASFVPFSTASVGFTYDSASSSS